LMLQPRSYVQHRPARMLAAAIAAVVAKEKTGAGSRQGNAGNASQRHGSGA
jgi:hypothetical protein